MVYFVLRKFIMNCQAPGFIVIGAALPLFPLRTSFFEVKQGMVSTYCHVQDVSISVANVVSLYVCLFSRWIAVNTPSTADGPQFSSSVHTSTTGLQQGFFSRRGNKSCGGSSSSSLTHTSLYGAMSTAQTQIVTILFYSVVFDTVVCTWDSWSCVFNFDVCVPISVFSFVIREAYSFYPVFLVQYIFFCFQLRPSVSLSCMWCVHARTSSSKSDPSSWQQVLHHLALLLRVHIICTICLWLVCSCVYKYKLRARSAHVEVACVFAHKTCYALHLRLSLASLHLTKMLRVSHWHALQKCLNISMGRLCNEK